MGVVYRVYDAETAMEVALKTIGVSHGGAALLSQAGVSGCWAASWTPEKAAKRRRLNTGQRTGAPGSGCLV